METTETPLNVALGMLTPSQVASQIPFPLMDDSLFCTQRLIGRSSIPTVKIGSETRVTIEALKAFLQGGGTNADARAKLGLPMETLTPIFQRDGEWFTDARRRNLSGWVDSVLKLMKLALQQVAEKDRLRQLGAGVAQTIPLAGEFTISPADQAAVLNSNKNGGVIAGGPELAALMLMPVQQMLDSSFLQMPKTDMTPDFSMFRNVGELFLTTELQACAQSYLVARARRDYPVVLSSGIDELYSSPETYLEVVNAALQAMATKIGFATSVGTSATVVLRDNEILNMLGAPSSMLPRLASLAF